MGARIGHHKSLAPSPSLSGQSGVVRAATQPTEWPCGEPVPSAYALLLP